MPGDSIRACRYRALFRRPEVFAGDYILNAVHWWRADNNPDVRVDGLKDVSVTHPK
jgi:hypothetical protein